MASSPTSRLDRDEGEGHDDGAIEDANTDATLASSIEDDLESKPRSHSLGISSTTEEPPSRSILHGAQFATPASSVGSPEADIIPQTKLKGAAIALVSTP
jgi:hypothetical protein